MAWALTATGAGPAFRWPSRSPPPWSARPCATATSAAWTTRSATYIPQMKGSAYDDVSIRQLLTMTSGVRWNEDYATRIGRGALQQPQARRRRRRAGELHAPLPREAPAGTRWHYSTGETNLVGILLSQATKRRWRTYLSEKIWVPAGHGAAGHLDPEQDRAGDQRLLHPGRDARLCAVRAVHLNGAHGRAPASCPMAGWPRPPPRMHRHRPARRGYGYQWWTYADGSFAARGIFGQGIFIDPKRKLVIAPTPTPTGVLPAPRTPPAEPGPRGFTRAAKYDAS
jgi:CubicO group peptidase (beta-lactamase class C family)